MRRPCVVTCDHPEAGRLADFFPGWVSFLAFSPRHRRWSRLTRSVSLDHATISTVPWAVPVLLMLHRLQRRASFSLILAGAALLVVALVITLSVNVPIDYAINRWTVDTLPSDWTSIRNRWEAYHAARTFISLAGFGFVLAAVVWSRDAVATTV